MKTTNTTVMKSKLLKAAFFMMGLLAPAGAFAASDNPVQKMFDAIKSSLEPVRDNKAVIMSIVGVVGIIMAIIAWGSDSSANNPKLTNVIKGAFLIVILIEGFLFFV